MEERDVGRFVEQADGERKRVPSGRKVQVPILDADDLEVSEEATNALGKAHILKCANAGLDLAARREPAKKAETAKKMASIAETDPEGLVQAIKEGRLEAFLAGE